MNLRYTNVIRSVLAFGLLGAASAFGDSLVFNLTSLTQPGVQSFSTYSVAGVDNLNFALSQPDAIIEAVVNFAPEGDGSYALWGLLDTAIKSDAPQGSFIVGTLTGYFSIPQLANGYRLSGNENWGYTTNNVGTDYTVFHDSIVSGNLLEIPVDIAVISVDGPVGTNDVDFELTLIPITTPEPATWALVLLPLLAMVGKFRSKMAV